MSTRCELAEVVSKSKEIFGEKNLEDVDQRWRHQMCAEFLPLIFLLKLWRFFIKGQTLNGSSCMKGMLLWTHEHDRVN